MFLRAAFPHIKIAVESQSSDNKEFLIIKNALKFLQNRNDFYLKNCAKLNGGKLDSTAQITAKKDAPLSQIVHSIMVQFELFSSVALQILQDSVDYDDLDEFIAYLESAEIALSSDEKSQIQIMTIHKSKGLEFEDVIICERGGQKKGVEPFYRERFDSERVFYMEKNADSRARRAFVDDEFAHIVESQRKSTRDDALNLLYVAFTRAKESLYIINSPQTALNLEILGLNEAQIGEDSVSEWRDFEIKDSAKIPEQVSFGKQGDFVSEDSTHYASKSTIKGLALHLALELCLAYKMPKMEIKNVLQNRFGLVLCGAELDSVMGSAEKILQNRAIKALLESADSVRCEVAYIDGKMRRIDCLVEVRGEAVILDYKSSDLNLEAKKAQVREYVAFASRHYERARGILCFANGEILEV